MTDTQPWYKRCRRWGQTNLTEIDPKDYDAAFWRDYWQRSRVQGIIVNAGGIVCYYPSRFEHQYRAAHLEDRDLLGEIISNAREQGLAVLARMDSNRALGDFYNLHPDWFCVNHAGEPCRAGDRYIACVNGPYYREYLPQVLEEIIQRYNPDGFTDNSWTGLGRKYICCCEHCRKGFRDATGLDLPQGPDWNDMTYRRWIRWNYQCRVDLWQHNNRVAQAAGGPDCLWLGMLNGAPCQTHVSFADLHAIGKLSKIVMCDQQSRTSTGFGQNAYSGKLLHDVAGWDVVIPESMAMYVRGRQTFRLGANPPAEAQTWMAEGYAGGISPWWHFVGARRDDRRKFQTPLERMAWHEQNEQYLYDRTPLASVGIAWTHENADFYGRDDARHRVLMPRYGFTRALQRARIDHSAVHLDNLHRWAEKLKVLVLPDLAVMSDKQARSIEQFVQAGGSIVATGRTSLMDIWGNPRENFALAQLLGVDATNQRMGPQGEPSTDWEIPTGHNYIRLPDEPTGRHPILAGFEQTDILPLGGSVECTAPRQGQAQTIATLIPAFPIYPPEFAWMRQERTDIPAICARELPSGGRVVYLPADCDRAFGLRGLPDHGDLLAKAVRWAHREPLPLEVQSPGKLDCHLYRQQDRLILHLVNLTGCEEEGGYREEFLPAGPVDIRIQSPGDFLKGKARRLVGQDQEISFDPRAQTLTISLEQIRDHQVVVLE